MSLLSATRRALPAMIALLLLLLVWQLLHSVVKVPAYLLPSPGALAQRLLSESSDLRYHALMTALSSFIGFIIGATTGWFSAMLFSLSTPIRHALYPYMIALKSIPIVVIAPFVALWLGTDLTARVVVVALTTFFPLLVNCVRGFAAADPKLLEILLVYRASRWQVFWRLRLPASLPYLFAGMKVSAVLAVVAALVVEMLGADNGLGFVLMISLYRIDTEGLFCVTVVGAMLSLFIYGAVIVSEKWLLPWIPKEVL